MSDQQPEPEEYSLPDWVKPGAAFLFNRGLAGRKKPRKLHVRAIVDGRVVLREWTQGAGWDYTVESPSFFVILEKDITQAKP